MKYKLKNIHVHFVGPFTPDAASWRVRRLQRDPDYVWVGQHEGRIEKMSKTIRNSTLLATFHDYMSTRKDGFSC